MINVHFHGSLAKKFGKAPIKLAVANPRMLFRGLECNLPEFKQVMHDMAEKNQNLSIVCENGNVETAYSIKPETMNMKFGKTQNVHIVADVEGAGIEAAVAAFYVYLGASAAVAATLATITINIAVSVVLGAVAQALAPSPDTSGNGNEKADQRASLIFNGPVNTVAQGGCIPLVYGECLTGSVVISAGVSVEELVLVDTSYTDDVGNPSDRYDRYDQNPV